MDCKGLKCQFLGGSLARRLIVKIFLFALAMIVISFTQIAHEIRTIEPLLLNFDECPIEFVPNTNSNSNPRSKVASGVLGSLSALLTPCKESENLTIGVLKELMKKGMLDSDARALCVGEGSALAVSALRELGFSNAYGVQRHPFFTLLQKRFVYELDFKDNYFDFVFSRALDKVSVPALLVLEIERVLRPGGTGAMLLGAPNFSSGSLVRSATPVSLYLKSSNVVHVCGIGSFTLVIFKKRFDNVALFEHFRLPNECPSITNNKPFMKYIEPLVNKESGGQHDAELSFLPKFMNISSRNRLMYINIGAGELVDSSITKALKPNYPIQPQDFNVYVIDHNPASLSSYVKNPGITFVYHPGLVTGESAAPSITSEEYFSAPMDEEGFEIIRWFKETIEEGDYVILMMNAGVAELKLLFELFETGAICHIDELFLRCSDNVNCKSGSCGDCMSLFKGLRNGGVFVHQWYGN